MNEKTLRYDGRRASVLCSTLSEMLAAFQSSAASFVKG
jgi:hypothetical protein